jgi:hypothetical protein
MVMKYSRHSAGVAVEPNAGVFVKRVHVKRVRFKRVRFKRVHPTRLCVPRVRFKRVRFSSLLERVVIRKVMILYFPVLLILRGRDPPVLI